MEDQQFGKLPEQIIYTQITYTAGLRDPHYKLRRLSGSRHIGSMNLTYRKQVISIGNNDSVIYEEHRNPRGWTPIKKGRGCSSGKI